MAIKVSEACVSFAGTGKPLAKDLPEWKPYDIQHGYTMLLDDVCRLVENPNRELIESALKNN